MDLPHQYETSLHGIKILYEEAPSANTFAFGIWVQNGSRHEKKNEYGYAHFLEHILFKSIPHASPRQIAKKIDSLGGYINASTSREDTQFYGVFTNDLINKGIELILQIVLYGDFPAKEVEREKGVVLEEIKMYRDTPDDYLIDLFMEKAYSGYDLAHNELGTEKSVSSITKESIEQYYLATYTTPRLLISMAGSLPWSEVLPKLEKHLLKMSSWLRPGKSQSPAKKKMTIRQGEFHEERDLEQIHFAFAYPGYSARDPKKNSLALFDLILGGNQSSLLYQELREKMGLCYFVGSSTMNYSDTGFWGVYGSTDPKHYPFLYEKSIQVIKKFLLRPLSAADLEATKNYFKINLMMSLESMNARMSRLAKKYMIDGELFSASEYLRKINAITRDNIRQIAEEITENGPYCVVTLGPKGAADE